MLTTRDELCLMMLWRSLVLSKLEYCCQLWNPNTVGEIEELEVEAVQRSFTSKNWEHLKLYSLPRRREPYHIIYTWSILEGLVPNVGIKLTQNRTRGRSYYTEGPQNKLAEPSQSYLALTQQAGFLVK